MGKLSFNWDGRSTVTFDEDTFEYAKLMLLEGKTTREVVDDLMKNGMTKNQAIELLVIARREADRGK